MTRSEYIRQLEFSLTGRLPQKEISDILRDYSEYFEAGKAEGKTEEEIVVSLGIPFAVAAEILSEDEENLLTGPDKKKGFRWFCKQERAADGKGEEGEDPLWLRAAGLFSPASLWRRLRRCARRLRAYLRELLGGAQEEAPGGGEQPPPPDPARTDAAEAIAPRAEGPSAGGRLLSALLFVLLFPFIALVLFLGGIVLLFTAAAFVFTGALLFFLFAAGVLASFLGGAALALTGGVLPGTALASGILLLLACLSGAVFALCLSVWTFRGLSRLIRCCVGARGMGGGDSRKSARNPAYRAARTGSAPTREEEWEAAAQAADERDWEGACDRMVKQEEEARGDA